MPIIHKTPLHEYDQAYRTRLLTKVVFTGSSWFDAAMWCDQQTFSWEWTVEPITFYFEDPKIAMLFKLMWC